MTTLPYLTGYPLQLIEQIQVLIKHGKLEQYLFSRYPDTHQINNDKLLRDHVLAIKDQFLKQSSPVAKVQFDNKLHVVKNALGTHTYVSKNHGGKLKRKNEIRISSIFKECPQAFLDMIVVHELAHIKELEHNKAFYKLCNHMLPEYHQIEFDTRVYLTYLEMK